MAAAARRDEQQQQSAEQQQQIEERESKKESKELEAERKTQGKEVLNKYEGLTDKYFTRDAQGKFQLKQDLDKHDILTGMREVKRLIEEDWDN